MTLLLPPPEIQFLDGNGRPYAGGSVAFFTPGTDTPRDTWADRDSTVLNTNPVILDAAGRAIIWGTGDYRCILKDANGNLIYDQVTSVLDASAFATMAEVTAAVQVETDRATAAESSLRTDLNAEITRATAAEDALDTRVTALEDVSGSAGVTGVQGGAAMTDGSGFYHLVFPTPFATACDSVVVTPDSNLFVSVTCAVNFIDRTSCEIRLTEAGSPTPVPSGAFMWLALGH